MRAAVPAEGLVVSIDIYFERIRDYGCGVREATYWARLSDLEKALLQCGQMYGRSWVCVLTCLAARKKSAAAEIKMKHEECPVDLPNTAGMHDIPF